jgi:putative spermidine/putrescine transport system permease protein
MRLPGVGATGLTLLLLVVIAFMLLPEVFVVANSFSPAALSGEALLQGTTNSGPTLHWYQAALAYAPFATGLSNSLLVAASSTLMAVVAGSLASVALTRHQFPGRESVRSLLLSPMAFPRVALGLGAYILFLRGAQLLNVQGLVVGTPVPLAIVHSLLGLPVVIVVVSASLLGIDPALEEAAMDLGATSFQTLIRVTFPLVRTALVISAVFAFMFSFDEVEASFFLSPVSRRTLPIEMFVFMEKDQSPTIAALSSLLMLGTILVVTVLGLLTGWRRLMGTWLRG